jgi:hypothetical protein
MLLPMAGGGLPGARHGKAQEVASARRRCRSGACLLKQRALYHYPDHEIPSR